MLSLKEINEISFGKSSFSGYKPEDVDSFIDEVVNTVKTLTEERDTAKKQSAELQAKNVEMQEKLGVLAKKIESYRKDEDGIKEAILSAQRVARGSVSEATSKAEVIVADAEERARDILNQAKMESSKLANEYAAQAEQKKAELEEMKKQVTAFRVSLLEMYKKHLELIDHIPTFKLKEEQNTYSSYGSDTYSSYTSPYSSRVSASQTTEEKVAEPETEKTPDPEPEPEIKDEAKNELDQKIDFSAAEEPSSGNDQQTSPQLSTLEEDEDVGINMNAYNDIPESLAREKKSRFSNLEFGDGIDVTKHK